MPSAADLPHDLSDLSRRQALAIRDASFEQDAKLLASALQQAPGLAPGKQGAFRRQWVWILAACALLFAMAAGVYRWREAASVNLDGTWIAEMRTRNQRPYRVRLDFVRAAGAITGAVSYPTGDGAIQSGELEGGRLNFFTVHVPQFAYEAATIRWTGVVDGDSIHFTAADESGVATGTARRRRTN
jgi:hypothetical protein